jgi:hypothetical protein
MRVSLLHSVIDVLRKIGIDLSSSGRRNRSYGLHSNLLHIVLHQHVYLGAAIREPCFAMRVGLHDEVHVDLDGLKLFTVMNVSILRELLCDIFETICEHAATLVSLRELLLGWGIGMKSEVSKLICSVRWAHDGRLRGAHCHSVGGINRRLGRDSGWDSSML